MAIIDYTGGINAATRTDIAELTDLPVERVTEILNNN
jgi:hypothetical protein